MGLQEAKDELLRATKYTLQTICAACDYAEGKYGRPDGLDMSVSELFRIEAHRFLMYLASSDGKIVPEERDFMNALFGMNLSTQDYVRYITQADIYSVDFENAIPYSIKFMADYEKRIREDEGVDDGTSMLPLMMQFLESTGEFFIKIDGETQTQEIEDLNTYISAKKAYLNSILKTIDEEEGGIIGPKKGSVEKESQNTNYNQYNLSDEEENALEDAKDYIDSQPFSHDELVEQLEYNGYSHDLAVYAVDNCGADWDEQALKAAEDYIDSGAFSYEGLIEQLEYNKHSHASAVYAADHCGADWDEQALIAAQEYLDSGAFSYKGLIEQLEYNKYSHESAVYAADHCGADWDEQASIAAQEYLDSNEFSRQELIEQLEYNGFTHSQAVYGVDSVGF